MKMLCWLKDHDWRWIGYGSVRHARCRRCADTAYENVTLPERIRALRIPGRIARLKAWIRSRPCWLHGHSWSNFSEVCTRCKRTGTDVAESSEWTLVEWKQLWRGWLYDRFHVVEQYLEDQSIYAVQVLGSRFGVERSTIYIASERYMTRYMLYLGMIGLRVHKFYRGDDDSAPHTHPWPFITFPFTSYVEALFDKGKYTGARVVKRFRFHYRPHDHEHIVLGPKRFTIRYAGTEIFQTAPDLVKDFKPFWTFVITGRKSPEGWGFYPEPGKFVYWRDYKPGVRTKAKGAA